MSINLVLIANPLEYGVGLPGESDVKKRPNKTRCE